MPQKERILEIIPISQPSSFVVKDITYIDVRTYPDHGMTYNLTKGQQLKISILEEVTIKGDTVNCIHCSCLTPNTNIKICEDCIVKGMSWAVSQAYKEGKEAIKLPKLEEM